MKAQFFPQPYQVAPCDIFTCTKRAKYFIGLPQPSDQWNLCLRVCEDCARDIIENLPEELLKYAIPKGKVLIDESELEKLKAKSVKYICNICGKEFDTPQGLSGHMNVHVKERK